MVLEGSLVLLEWHRFALKSFQEKGQGEIVMSLSNDENQRPTFHNDRVTDIS